MKDEIDSLRHYFNIQKSRYANKLDVSLDVDPAAEEYPIPGFILYPLAENAVLHGLRSSPLPLRIRIQAGIREGRFLVEIFNSGSWNANRAPENGRPEGRGLDNVRRRLAETYPGKHQLDIIEKDGGDRVRLSLPATAGAGP